MNRALSGAGLLLAMTLAAGAQAAETSVRLGVDYTSGKYGTDTTTDITTLPITWKYDSDRWHFGVVLPYIHVSGSANVIPGVGGTANGNPRGRGRNGSGVPTTDTTGSASGLGDVVASAGYTLVSNADTGFGLDLTGKVKFGTADADKGLGTGKNDYTLALDAYQARGDWTWFGGVAYTQLGSSDYLKLNDVFGANVGASYRLDQASSWGAAYDYREKASDQGAARSEVSVFYNRKVGDAASLQAYALAGLADGSPDWGGGISVKYGF